MVQGGCQKCMKICLFIFNIVCCLAGLGMVIACAVCLADKGTMDKFKSEMEGNEDIQKIWEIFDQEQEESKKTFKFILIGGCVVGGLIFLTCFLACCGAITENKCALLTFVGIMTALALIQLILGILVFAMKSKIEEVTDKIVDRVYDHKKSKDGADPTDLDINETEDVNDIREYCQLVYTWANKAKMCCGQNERAAQNPPDWAGRCATAFDEAGPGGSIVKEPEDTAPEKADWKTASKWQECHEDTQDSKLGGCKKQMLEMVWGIILIAGIVILSMLFLEIFAIVFATSLACSIKS